MAAQQADGNLRKALLSLEACKVTQYPFTADQSVQQTDWELYLQEVTADILAEQSPKCLLGIRTKLYELIINCIPPVLILKVWAEEREQERQRETRMRARLNESACCGKYSGPVHPHAPDELVAYGMQPAQHFALDAFNPAQLQPARVSAADLRERVVADWRVVWIGWVVCDGRSG
jgi:hypothetical protein